MFLDLIAVNNAKAKLTPKFRIAISTIPVAANQNSFICTISTPNDETAAAKDPDESVTCLTSRPKPKNFIVTGVNPSKKPKDILAARDEIFFSK